MTRLSKVVGLLAVIGLLVLLPVSSATASPVPQFPHIPGLPSCKSAPVPDMPGQGLAAFFSNPPKHLPPPGDPFAKGSNTTIYEQYGYAGLTWHNYDLGCGPAAARDPGAVIGTALANWLQQAPIALTALTGSITQQAFHPTFMGVFDPVIRKVSTALHGSLFATWVPAVLALLGIAVIFRARRAALATTAAAIAWAIFVVLVATALFRWPVAAGHIADQTVTGTLGTVVGHLEGGSGRVDPGTAVASHIEESILYRAWVAGTLGSPDSPTAKKYGPALFKAQALTWRQARIVERNPDLGQQIISQKQQQWQNVAGQVKNADPAAYQYLTGQRSEARVGYSIVGAVATYLALPFLLVSALLLLGCFLIVRLAVMMFPAFATLGAFPATRSLVVGLGRTVGAAVVNAIVFGIGAGVTIAVLGLLFHPGGGTPGWLSLILMPLFSFIMWVALKPFRRLTHMVSPHDNHFGHAAGSFGDAARTGGRWGKRATATAVGVFTGNVVAAAATGSAADQQEPPSPATPERAEAQPSAAIPAASRPAPLELPAGTGSPEPQGPAPHRTASSTPPHPSGSRPGEDFVDDGFPRPSAEAVPPPPTEPEWVDGEEVYTIYRPDAPDESDAGDAA